MIPKVYIETTVISILTAWPSRDVVRAAQQQTTHEWWSRSAANYNRYISELVIIEAQAGDPVAANDRLEVVSTLPVLSVTEASTRLAETLLRQKALPQTEPRDALHVALAATHQMDYLLTWNFKHIANAVLREKIQSVCKTAGYHCPVICTPDELLESS